MRLRRWKSQQAKRSCPPVWVVEHRDRLMRFGVEYVEAALAAQGRRAVVIDGAEVTDDMVRDLHEVIVSRYARRYGKRGAKNRQESHRGHAVRLVLSHRIALVPTARQEVLLRQAVGVSRFAYILKQESAMSYLGMD